MKMFIYFLLIILTSLNSLAGSSFNLSVFTENGAYSNSEQLNYSLNISPLENDYVSFDFINNSSIHSTIETILFQDFFSIIQENDITIQNYQSEEQIVNFEIDRKPRILPSGQNLIPYFDTDFSISALSSPAHNGINTEEHLTVILKINGGYTQVIENIVREDLRIGAHIIGFPDNSSESAVIQVVPEPSSLLLCLLGLSGLAYARKFHNEKKNKEK